MGVIRITVKPPTGFIMYNRDQDPVKFIHVKWDETTDAKLRSNYLRSNTTVRKSAVETEYPDWVSAHLLEICGYRLHRDTAEDFEPTGEIVGVGNLIVDEATLTPMVTEFVDYDVEYEETWHYKITNVVQ